MAGKAKNTMIGRYYTFFLGNKDFSKSWYLYQVASTGLSEDWMYPMVTLAKVGERTGQKDFSASKESMMGSDIISTIIGNRDGIENVAPGFIEKQIFNGIEGSYSPILKKYPPEVHSRGLELPSWEIVAGTENYATKLVIIELRDKLRWKRYKFIPGNFIDLIITPTKFGLLEIKGDKENLWLEPRGVYQMDDTNLRKGVNKEFAFPDGKFSGPTKESDMNRAIRRFEWRSFSNAEFKI